MSESKRKTFSGAQKAKVAVEAIKGLKTINQIAQGHGVHPTQANQWKKELLANAGDVFETKRGPKPIDAQSDPDRLYAKIGQLNFELDWLKKIWDRPVADQQLAWSGPHSEPQVRAAVDADIGVGRHGARPQHQQSASISGLRNTQHRV